MALLGDAVPLAFWFDGATYLASALLLARIVVGPRRGRATEGDGRPAPATTGFFGELLAGWRFLRNEPVLLANTLQASVAQLTIGVLIALTAVYASEVVRRQRGFDWQAVYGFIETGDRASATWSAGS